MAGSEFSWRVTGVVTGQTVLNSAGKVVTGTYTYFVTGKGNEGSVFTEDTKFTEHTVKDQVRNHARLLDRIGSLAEGSME